MTRKAILKWGLLIFVAVSVSWALVREARKPEVVEPSVQTAEVVPAAKAGKEKSFKVIAYYFHGTRRCPTCRKIEAYTQDALYEEFSGEIENGLLEWRPLNIDESGNEHYIQDYKLVTRSVVLSAVKNGEEERWRNLDKVWSLVGDRYAFTEYIKKETRELLGGG